MSNSITSIEPFYALLLVSWYLSESNIIELNCFIGRQMGIITPSYTKDSKLGVHDLPEEQSGPTHLDP